MTNYDEIYRAQAIIAVGLSLTSFLSPRDDIEIALMAYDETTIHHTPTFVIESYEDVVEWFYDKKMKKGMLYKCDCEIGIFIDKETQSIDCEIIKKQFVETNEVML